MTKKRYYLFRYGKDAKQYGYRMESGASPQEACHAAFGVVYAAPYSGNVVFKDLGTRSPAYAPQKTKQIWYGDSGWQTIPGAAVPAPAPEQEPAMDPTQNLVEQVELAAEIIAAARHGLGPAGTETALERGERLAELVLALDGWLSRGGHLPRSWANARKGVRP